MLLSLQKRRIVHTDPYNKNTHFVYLLVCLLQKLKNHDIERGTKTKTLPIVEDTCEIFMPLLYQRKYNLHTIYNTSDYNFDLTNATMTSGEMNSVRCKTIESALIL